MTKRPRDLVFSRNEQPPRRLIVLLAIQHAVLSMVFLFYAVIIAKGAGFTPPQQQSLLVGTLLTCGISAILQAGSARLSSGQLVIPLTAPATMVFAIQAGQDAGPAGIATLAIIGVSFRSLSGAGSPTCVHFFHPRSAALSSQCWESRWFRLPLIASWDFMGIPLSRCLIHRQ